MTPYHLAILPFVIWGLGVLVGWLLTRHECPARHPETGGHCHCRRGHAGQHATFKRTRIDWSEP